MPNTVPANSEAMPISREAQTITSLFTLWRANPDSKPGADYSGMSEAQMDQVFAEYTTLQNQIIDAVPATAKEAAQQIIVATDGGASEMPSELFERFRQMAYSGGEAA